MGEKLVLPEFTIANKIMIETQLGMRKGDEMLIPTNPSLLDLAEATQTYATSIGIKTYIVVPPPLERGETSKALQSIANEVDGIYWLGGGGFDIKVAMGHGARVLGVAFSPGEDEPLVRTMVHVNIHKLKEEAWKIGEAFTEADTLRITSEEGTDYTEDISGKVGTVGALWAGDPKEVPYEYVPLATPGIDRQPPKGRGNGTLVYDGYVSPIGPLKEPVTVTVDRGEVTDIKGGYDAFKFKQLFDSFPEKYLAEIQIGINPNARLISPSGRIYVEWERIRGSLHVGMGDWMPYPAYDGGKLLNPDWKPAKHHCDGLMLRPTVYLDDKLVIKKGVIQKPYSVL